MIKVLVVEDSAVIASLIQMMLSAEADIEVVGHAHNGLEGVEMTKKLKPDIITMDIRMPVMDGFEATKRIMAECPTPILVVSASVNDEDLNITFNAINAGVLDVIEKPDGVTSHENYIKISHELVEKIRLLSEIKVITRKYDISKFQQSRLPNEKVQLKNKDGYHLLALATSTGGPQVIKVVLETLPEHFPLPVFIVQHISENFVEGYVNWLNDCSKLTVKLAADYEVVEPGHVYVAPTGLQMKVHCYENRYHIRLVKELSASGFVPSADVLFDSLSISAPKQVIAGLLTGMGSDGAAGLNNIYLQGGYTFIQDKASSVVFGMPGSAKELGCYYAELSPYEISNHVINLLNESMKKRGEE